MRDLSHGFDAELSTPHCSYVCSAFSDNPLFSPPLYSRVLCGAHRLSFPSLPRSLDLRGLDRIFSQRQLCNTLVHKFVLEIHPSIMLFHRGALQANYMTFVGGQHNVPQTDSTSPPCNQMADGSSVPSGLSFKAVVLSILLTTVSAVTEPIFFDALGFDRNDLLPGLRIMTRDAILHARLMTSPCMETLQALVLYLVSHYFISIQIHVNTLRPVVILDLI